MTNNNEKEEKVIIRWNSTPFKPTVYTTAELATLREPAGPGGAGYKYFNPTKNQYEKPASIDLLPPSPKKKKTL